MNVHIPDHIPGRTPAEQVFGWWQRRQRIPSACKLTDDRRKLLNRALQTYSAHDLCILVEYAYTSQEPGPRFWRGENDSRRTYLDLSNLLRASKLPGRVEAALAWAAHGDEPSDENEEIDPVAMQRALTRRAPGEPPPQATTRGTPAPRRGPRWE